MLRQHELQLLILPEQQRPEYDDLYRIRAAVSAVHSLDGRFELGVKSNACGEYNPGLLRTELLRGVGRFDTGVKSGVSGEPLAELRRRTGVEGGSEHEGGVEGR